MQAPEFSKRKIDQIDLTGLPTPDSPDFETALIAKASLELASKGLQGLVVVRNGYVYTISMPLDSIDPRAYILGLLENRFLEDALPMLEALTEMFDDPEAEYNLGLCLSELGQFQQCIAHFHRCIELEPNNANAFVGLGVAQTRLDNIEDAKSAFFNALKLQPDNLWAARNLGALLTRTGKPIEALPLLRKAHSIAPADPSVMLGLAECLEQLGSENQLEAGSLYDSLIHEHGNSAIGDIAREGRNRISNRNLHSAVNGGVRMDAVMYMQGAMKRFEQMDKVSIGKAVLEIAQLGTNGLEINDPDVRYRLKSLEGDFSGLHLLCLMHVGIKTFDPSADSGSGLDKEYDMALRFQPPTKN